MFMGCDVANFLNLDELERDKIKKVINLFNKLKFVAVRHDNHFCSSVFLGDQTYDLRKYPKKIIPDTSYVLNLIYSASDNQGAVPLGESIGVSFHVSPVSINDPSPGFINMKVSRFKTENLGDYYLDIFSAKSSKTESKKYENVSVSKAFNFYEALVSLEAIDMTLKEQTSLSRNEKRYVLLALLGKEFDLPINVNVHSLTEDKKIKALEGFKEDYSIPNLEAAIKSFGDDSDMQNQEDLETSPFYQKLEKLKKRLENLAKENRVLNFNFEKTKKVWKEELLEHAASPLLIENIEEFDEKYLESEKRQNALEAAKLLKENIEKSEKCKLDISRAENGLSKYRHNELLSKNSNTEKTKLISVLNSANNKVNKLLKEYEESSTKFVDNGFLNVIVKEEKVKKALSDLDVKRKDAQKRVDGDFLLSTRYKNSLSNKRKM